MASLQMWRICGSMTAVIDAVVIGAPAAAAVVDVVGSGGLLRSTAVPPLTGAFVDIAER